MSLDVLGIGIKVDPADSAAKADAVTTALHKTEDTGIAAGRAMLGLAGNFKSLAAALEQERAALDRNAASHRYLNSSAAAAAGAFGKMAEAMQREKAMLEQIHGPAERYMRDLQTLDSLLHRNAISASEYAQQVTRLNHELDGAPRAANGNMPTTTGGGAGALGALRGAAATVGLGFGASQIVGAADEFQNLQNRLRYLAGGDMQKVNELFEKLQGVAGRTRGDISSTTEAFVRMSLATKQMNLSSDETLRLTERLNKAITLSGASSAEASAGMIQLSQGLASGALRGDELRSVMESLPAVADVIAQSMGVTRGQLRQMGADGKITADVIVNAFRKAGNALDADFGNTVPTISQSWTMFKNEIMVTVGQLDKATGMSNLLGGALQGVLAIVKTALIPVQAIGGALNSLGISAGVATGALAGMALGGPVGALAGATLAIAAQAGAFDDVGKALTGTLEKYQKLEELQNKMNVEVSSGGAAFRGATSDLVQYNLQLALGAEAAEAFRAALAKANTAGAVEPFMGVGEFDKAVDAFHKATTAGQDWFVVLDASHKRSNEMRQDRMNEVTAAKAELAALELAKGGVVDYAAKKQKLLDIINGTTSGHRKEIDELKRLRNALLGVESASARAIRQGAANRAGDQAEISFVAELDSRTSFDAAARYRAEVQQINWLHHQGMVDSDLFARGIADINNRYVDALGLTEAVRGKTNDYEQSIVRLRQAYDQGAISAAQFNDAAAKLWMGSEQKKAEDEAQARIDKAQEDLAKRAEEHARRVQDAWASSLGSIAGSFLDMARTGEFSFDKLLHQATQIALQMAAMQMGGPGGTFLSSLAGSLGGFAGGGSFTVPSNSNALMLPRAANGARWTVGGSGGVDSKIAMFRVTPGEHIDVRTPAQVATGGGMSAEMFGRLIAAIERGSSPTIVVSDDPAERVDGYSGARMQTRVDRRRGRAAR